MRAYLLIIYLVSTLMIMLLCSHSIQAQAKAQKPLKRIHTQGQVYWINQQDTLALPNCSIKLIKDSTTLISTSSNAKGEFEITTLGEWYFNEGFTINCSCKSFKIAEIKSNWQHYEKLTEGAKKAYTLKTEFIMQKQE